MAVRLGNDPVFTPAAFDPQQSFNGAELFEKLAGQTAATATATPRLAAEVDGFIDPDSGIKDQMRAQFQAEFGAKAANKEEFHDFMKQVFGENYDPAMAEGYRQKALAGDYSWLPPIRFVDSATLQGANGAYDAQDNVVLINENLRHDPAKAAQTYVEETGHFLDNKLNHGADTVGDEGEMFRRILGGEKLSEAQIAEIRADNDHGVITVDGKLVEVEFWNPFKAIKNAVGSAVSAVGDAVKSVGHAAVEVVKGVGETVAGVATGIGEGVGGFFSNLVHGNVGDAFSSLAHGLDKAVLQAPMKLVNRTFNAAQSLVDGFTPLLPFGSGVRNVLTRGIDIGRTLTNTAQELVRDVYGTMTEVPIGFVSDMEKSLKHLFKGEFSEAAKSFGMAFVNVPARAAGGVVDMVMRGLQGLSNVIGVGTGLQPPSRGLTDTEIATLKEVYGDSIDYSQIRVHRGGITELGMAPHTVGNDVYMRETWDGAAQFNADGTLTASGMQTLIHEVGHVWQSQNGGGDYIHKALWAQAVSAVGSGDRNGAYDWRPAAGKGVAFRDLNPEQQAHLTEEIGVALRGDSAVTASDWTPPLSANELAYVLAAWDEVKNGQGAP